MDPGDRWSWRRFSEETTNLNQPIKPQQIYSPVVDFDFLEKNSCWLEGSQRAGKQKSDLGAYLKVLLG